MLDADEGVRTLWQNTKKKTKYILVSAVPFLVQHSRLRPVPTRRYGQWVALGHCYSRVSRERMHFAQKLCRART